MFSYILKSTNLTECKLQIVFYFIWVLRPAKISRVKRKVCGEGAEELGGGAGEQAIPEKKH